MTCEHCGTEQAKPAHYSHRQWQTRRFCSTRCWAVLHKKPAALVHRTPHTPETRLKLRLANLGKPGWNRGRTVPDSVRQKISATLRGPKSSLWIDGRSRDVEYQRFRGRQKMHRRKTAVGSHTKAEWDALRALYGFACACCRRPESEAKLTEDHIVPVFKGGTNWIWNIQPLCQRCNSSKQTTTIHYEVPA